MCKLPPAAISRARKPTRCHLQHAQPLSLPYLHAAAPPATSPEYHMYAALAPRDRTCLHDRRQHPDVQQCMYDGSGQKGA
ncbi:hypothetical protein EVG20_g10864 [Dentipellis fragilis]|uniref:Uncharacterized protein n=1 Tax=Dentipellis fragilis TaxID=205917 RepID=A0A4Y9XRB4_9AGAM|nr:hypothetical protein EVG20_g10864 [Dentipellis fragilis]